jgi:acetyltransferase-like isoleucine patch superfamily enzyme|tara:strand:- start:663 stop:1193 length:531 start_codon:yes stop_codon:yes gene_type:complete
LFNSFYKDLVIAVEERGWRMPLGAIRLIYRFIIINYFFPMIARNVPNRFVPFFHRIRGVKIGKDVWIDKTVIIDEAYPENIIIEDDVRIAAGSVIVSHSRAGHYLRQHYVKTRISKVKICRYSFIGINCVIMPGVTIGEGCVVVSGSVVLMNTKPYSIVSGVPAIKIRDLKRIDAK